MRIERLLYFITTIRSYQIRLSQSNHYPRLLLVFWDQEIPRYLKTLWFDFEDKLISWIYLPPPSFWLFSFFSSQYPMGLISFSCTSVKTTVCYQRQLWNKTEWLFWVLKTIIIMIIFTMVSEVLHTTNKYSI